MTYHGTIEMYEYYQIMICLLKLDFFVFVGVTMQVSCRHYSLIGIHILT